MAAAVSSSIPWSLSARRKRRSQSERLATASMGSSSDVGAESTSSSSYQNTQDSITEPEPQVQVQPSDTRDTRDTDAGTGAEDPRRPLLNVSIPPVPSALNTLKPTSSPSATSISGSTPTPTQQTFVAPASVPSYGAINSTTSSTTTTTTTVTATTASTERGSRSPQRFRRSSSSLDRVPEEILVPGPDGYEVGEDTQTQLRNGNGADELLSEEEEQEAIEWELEREGYYRGELFASYCCWLECFHLRFSFFVLAFQSMFLFCSLRACRTRSYARYMRHFHVYHSSHPLTPPSTRAPPGLSLHEPPRFGALKPWPIDSSRSVKNLSTTTEPNRATKREYGYPPSSFSPLLILIYHLPLVEGRSSVILASMCSNFQNSFTRH